MHLAVDARATLNNACGMQYTNRNVMHCPLATSCYDLRLEITNIFRPSSRAGDSDGIISIISMTIFNYYALSDSVPFFNTGVCRRRRSLSAP